jgi:hypothetical protein
MLNITIYDVMEQHISNDEVRKIMESCSMEQMAELRHAQWLEKTSHMGAERGPRKILVAWTTNEHPSGCPQQTIQRGLASTRTDHLYLPTANMNNWIKLASNQSKWGKQIEDKVGLVPFMYKPYAECHSMDWSL